MSLSTDWLERLSFATTYADLREAYQQMAQQAESNHHNSSFADAIDQAIQKLIAERSRDERELNEVQARYDSFRQDNKGVVGWFKRHIPFTETRRQESEHKGEMADQAAEILADNLVIARAQIIKERLLPPERRRLGDRVTEWQAKWEQQRTRPPAAGAVLGQLHAELERSRVFVEELRKDIEAFGGAAFKDAEDRKRRDSDLVTARRELEPLTQEISAEQALLENSLQLLVGHVVAELAATDSDFRRDGEQLERVQACATRMEESRSGLAKLKATVGQINDAQKQLTSWPEQVRQIRDAIARLESERQAASQSQVLKTQAISERQSRVTDAQRSVDQATMMLNSLQPGYDAHLAQRQSQMSMPQQVELEPPSAIEQQYQAAKGMLDQAKKMFSDAQASVDSAKRDTAQAEAAVKSAADKLAAEQKKLNESEGKERQLRSELSSHVERGHREFAAVAAALAAYLQLDRATLNVPAFRANEIGAGTYGWIGNQGLERAFATILLQPGQDTTRQTQATTTLDRLHAWHEAQHGGLDQERTQARSRREMVWKRRCRELLGEKLAEQACHKGLPTS